DTGPNDLLNFPLLTSAQVSGANVTVYFKLDVPAGSYRIEFFKNPGGVDGTQYGEGEVVASSTHVTNPGAGFLNATFPGSVNDLITATTTRCTDGTCTGFLETSEFSRYVKAIPTPTAVTLMSFTATPRDRAVDLAWVTASELSNLGFHVYRSLS